MVNSYADRVSSIMRDRLVDLILLDLIVKMLEGLGHDVVVRSRMTLATDP